MIEDFPIGGVLPTPYISFWCFRDHISAIVNLCVEQDCLPQWSVHMVTTASSITTRSAPWTSRKLDIFDLL